jgi:hypothetical protein
MSRLVQQAKKRQATSASKSPFSNKQVADYYFKDVFVPRSVSSGDSVLEEGAEPELDRKRVCKCGLVLVPTKSGYTNEIGHIQTKHPDFMEVMKHETRQQTLTFVPTQDAKDLHLWMITIIIENREFSMVESPFVRLLANHRKHYSTETFMKYKSRVGLLVWKKIKDSLPDKF